MNKQKFVFTSLDNPNEPKRVDTCINYLTWGGGKWGAEHDGVKFHHYVYTQKWHTPAKPRFRAGWPWNSGDFLKFNCVFSFFAALGAANFVGL